MATIYRMFTVAAPADEVWSAIRDFGAVHKRLAIGFVTDVQVEGTIRIVTFANGNTVREQIVAIDEDNQRLAYSAIGGRATHHHASFEVFDDGSGECYVSWITDLLPDEAAAPIAQMMDQGIEAIIKTLGKK